MSSTTFDKLVSIEDAAGEIRLRIDLRHFQKQKDYAALTIFIIKTMTAAIVRNKEKGHVDFEAYVSMKDMTSKNVDPAFFIHMCKMLQENFVDVLRRAYVFDPPKMIRYIWNLMDNVMDADTKEKIIIIGENGKNDKASAVFHASGVDDSDALYK